MSESLKRGFEENKANVGHKFSDDLVELIKFIKILKFGSSKDMIPQELATMEETILFPLN